LFKGAQQEKRQALIFVDKNCPVNIILNLFTECRPVRSLLYQIPIKHRTIDDVLWLSPQLWKVNGLWRQLLPYGYSYRPSCARPSFV